MNYQSGVNGPGERDCEARWRLIRGELAPGALLDVGSAEGWFGLRAAAELGLVVASVEADAARAAAQCAALRATEGAKDGGSSPEPPAGRLHVCRFGWSADFGHRLAGTCEFFENALLLSVLHWLPEPEEVLAGVCAMAGRVFVELPEPDDATAGGSRVGPDLEEWLRLYSGRSVRLLGAVPAHTSATRRLWVLEGQMERKPTRAYLGAPVWRNRFLQRWDGRRLWFWKDGEKEAWTPGVNLWTLSKMRCAGADAIRAETAAALGAWEAEHGPHEDRNLWNVLATAEGLKWFDGRCDGAPDGLAGQLEGFGK